MEHIKQGRVPAPVWRVQCGWYGGDCGDCVFKTDVHHPPACYSSRGPEDRENYNPEAGASINKLVAGMVAVKHSPGGEMKASALIKALELVSDFLVESFKKEGKEVK